MCYDPNHLFANLLWRTYLYYGNSCCYGNMLCSQLAQAMFLGLTHFLISSITSFICKMHSSIHSETFTKKGESKMNVRRCWWPMIAFRAFDLCHLTWPLWPLPIDQSECIISLSSGNMKLYILIPHLLRSDKNTSSYDKNHVYIS